MLCLNPFSSSLKLPFVHSMKQYANKHNYAFPAYDKN